MLFPHCFFDACIMFDLEKGNGEILDSERKCFTPIQFPHTRTDYEFLIFSIFWFQKASLGPCTHTFELIIPVKISICID